VVDHLLRADAVGRKERRRRRVAGTAERDEQRQVRDRVAS
jgi:hypothetical protein